MGGSFRFEGAALRVPANLPQNVHLPEHRVRVTPAPAQVRLEVWGAGTGARAAALERALGHVADAGDDPAALGDAWRAAETPASIGAPRAARVPWDGSAALVARLHDLRAAANG